MTKYDQISVVGNADIFKTIGLLIDESDIVFRFNRARISGYEKYKGSLTTHMGVINEGQIAMSDTISKLDRSLYQDVSEIWFPRPKKNLKYERKFNEFINPVYGENASYTFRYCSDDMYNYLYKELDCERNADSACQPSTGITIIYMICQLLQFRKLLVTGFDGFSTVHYWEKRKREEDLKYHNGAGEMDFLKRLTKRYPIDII